MNLIRTKTRNINNQTVFKEIDDFMIEVFATLNIYWDNTSHRDQLVDMCDMWMEQYALESGKIIQYNIKCTYPSDDRVIFTLDYRQRNCFNTSVIEYTFEV